MKALLDRVHAVDPAWKVNGFLIDDAAAETDPIRYIIHLLFTSNLMPSFFCVTSYFLFGLTE